MWKVDSDEIFEKLGLDATVYLLFHEMLVKVFGLCAIGRRFLSRING